MARAEACDVADPDDVGGPRPRGWRDEDISILVNNAGIAGPVAPLVDITADEWDDVFAINVRGVFLMCRAFLPAMIERGAGDIINVASVSGKRPLARRTPYCASKMAVIGLTTTLAHEVGPLGSDGQHPLARSGRGPAHGAQLPPRGRAHRVDRRRGRTRVRRARGPRGWSPRTRSRAPWWRC